MKTQSFRQRLALLVNAAVSAPDHGVTFPYGFHAYAVCAAACMYKKLEK